jgi:hypothetical protein
MFGLTGRQITILLVLVALLFAATQYVPAYFAAFQFNDSVRQAVKFAGTSRKTVDNLRDDVFQHAKEFGIPITKKDILITRRGPSFTLQVDYRWPIDLKIYRHDLTFHISQNGELFENASN